MSLSQMMICITVRAATKAICVLFLGLVVGCSCENVASEADTVKFHQFYIGMKFDEAKKYYDANEPLSEVFYKEPPADWEPLYYYDSFDYEDRRGTLFFNKEKLLTKILVSHQSGD